MLAETMAAMAAGGGSAVVQAAGTDAWEGLRSRLALMFGRGNAHREQAELEHLDATAAALSASGRPESEAEAARIQQEIIWQTRFAGLLECVGDVERDALGEQLRALVAEHTAAAAAGRIEITHNTFSGPTAVQVGGGNTQEVTFGRTSE
ncbi:hypothetical protein [Streptomyces sp. NPDC090445]|uniref:hypothetical protein n=1 Tax=Streptomyces sp. NPDC090445 TaxID=3365963 RepID=UPI00382CFE73